MYIIVIRVCVKIFFLFFPLFDSIVVSQNYPFDCPLLAFFDFISILLLLLLYYYKNHYYDCASVV